MGGVVSVVQAAINLGKQVKVENDRVKNRKLDKEAARLAKPIIPPQPWGTLEARRKNVEKGPYTIDSIRDSLRDGVLPAGWSEEQLSNVGFETEIKKYQELLLKDRNDLRKSFGTTLSALTNAVRDALGGSDISQRTALATAGVTGITVARFENLAKIASAGGLDGDAVASAISEIKTFLETANAEKELAENKRDLQVLVDTANEQRGASLLAITQRVLTRRFPKVSRPLAVQ